MLLDMKTFISLTLNEQENMWEACTFQAYLRQIGKFDMWPERIFPGMQRAIVGTMLACQGNES